MRSNSAFTRLSDRLARRDIAAVVLAAVSLICLIGGLWLLWLHAQEEPQPFRAPAGILLVLMGALQARWAWLVLRRHERRTAWCAEPLLFLKTLFAGVVICYVAGLLLGPAPGVVYLFAAGVAAWYTLCLWAFVIRPAWYARAVGWMGHRLLSRTNQAVFTGVVTIVGAELAVRCYGMLTDDPLAESYVAKAHLLPPGEMIRGRQVNTLGYWDKEFQEAPRPGIFRIAVLGDAVTLSGTAETNCLAQIERRVPGVEIYNFGIPQAGPREYAAQLHEVTQFRPDLVLAFFSVGDDLTHELPLPGWFDWRGLRVYQLGALTTLVNKPAVQHTPLSAAASREEYLRESVPHLAVCRTPISDYMNQRWRQADGYLEQMVQHCRRAQLPLALVVVPGPFQVNRALCDTLRRQAGYEEKQIDLQLPQRRLAAFAARHRVPAVDLLPYFQSLGEPPYERYHNELNDHGNQVTAEVLGRWIEQHYRTQIASARHASN